MHSYMMDMLLLITVVRSNLQYCVLRTLSYFVVTLSETPAIRNQLDKKGKYREV